MQKALMDIFARTEMLVGPRAVEKLAKAHVAVFGVGGVGGFVAEALARSGIGQISVFDNDTVAESNVNRQIIATTDNIGKYKVDAICERLKAINPAIKVNAHNVFYLPENADKYPLYVYDYIVDAVDTVSAKLALIEGATAAKVPVVSSMGTGGKLEISALRVANIFKTSGCPLARVMRRELKARGISDLKVVYSEEPAANLGTVSEGEWGKTKAQIPSMIFVPAAAGLMLAREVVFDLIKE